MSNISLWQQLSYLHVTKEKIFSNWSHEHDPRSGVQDLTPVEIGSFIVLHAAWTSKNMEQNI